jgi:acyl-CoA thioester hydrolase
MAWRTMPDSVALWLHEAAVRPEWVDYNGHMNEAFYVLIFGDATDAFYDHVGLDHAARTAGRVSVYTVEAHIQYLVEAHEGEQLRIATRLLAHDAKRLRLHHAMHREADGQVLAVTELLALHVDKTTTRAAAFGAGPFARIEAVAVAQAELPALTAVSRHWSAA